MPTLSPNDMEYDVVEEEVATTSFVPPIATKINDGMNSTKVSDISNDRKRQRVQSTKTPISEDNSDLLANHVPLDHQNRFGILSVLADLDLQRSQPAFNLRKRVNKKVVQAETKIKWCSPISVYNVNIKALVDTLKSTIPDFSFKVKKINKNKSKLYFSDAKVHTSMMAILRTKNIHLFTRKELKQVSLFIRGLVADTDSKKVKTELDTLVPDTVASVKKFKTPSPSNKSNKLLKDDTEHSKHVNNTNISKSNSTVPTLACNQCHKLFTTISKLNRHKRYVHVSDEKKHPCHLCDLKFARNYHLKRHLRTVHSLNNFQLRVLQKDKQTTTANERKKIFYSPNKLKRHKRFVHVPEEKKHPCHLCDFKFARNYHLKRHLRTVHSCDNFQTRVLQKDKQTTTAREMATAITCNECKKIFYSPKKLKRHKRLAHVPEENKFTCNVCGNKFGRSDHFRRHMRNLHNTDFILPPKREIKVKDNWFACDKCDHSYTRRYFLYKHEREVHCQ